MAKKLVLAFFENEGSADSAVEAIKAWDKAEKEIKLGAIGVLALDDKGKVKTNKLGGRHTATGAVLGALVAVLPAVGLAAVAGGGLIGFFVHKGLGMSKEDLARIAEGLGGGRAAVGVTAKPTMADAIAAKLTELGGTVEAYEVAPEAEEHVEAAAAAAASEEGTEAATEQGTPA
jgi:uncharacterized membrane protein